MKGGGDGSAGRTRLWAGHQGCPGLQLPLPQAGVGWGECEGRPSAGVLGAEEPRGLEAPGAHKDFGPLDPVSSVPALRDAVPLSAHRPHVSLGCSGSHRKALTAPVFRLLTSLPQAPPCVQAHCPGHPVAWSPPVAPHSPQIKAQVPALTDRASLSPWPRICNQGRSWGRPSKHLLPSLHPSSLLLPALPLCGHSHHPQCSTAMVSISCLSSLLQQRGLSRQELFTCSIRCSIPRAQKSPAPRGTG